jgi:hypothetical protein
MSFDKETHDFIIEQAEITAAATDVIVKNVIDWHMPRCKVSNASKEACTAVMVGMVMQAVQAALEHREETGHWPKYSAPIDPTLNCGT